MRNATPAFLRPSQSDVGSGFVKGGGRTAGFWPEPSGPSAPPMLSAPLLPPRALVLPGGFAQVSAEVR